MNIRQNPSQKCTSRDLKIARQSHKHMSTSHSNTSTSIQSRQTQKPSNTRESSFRHQNNNKIFQKVTRQSQNQVIQSGPRVRHQSNSNNKKQVYIRSINDISSSRSREAEPIHTPDKYVYGKIFHKAASLLGRLNGPFLYMKWPVEIFTVVYSLVKTVSQVHHDRLKYYSKSFSFLPFWFPPFLTVMKELKVLQSSFFYPIRIIQCQSNTLKK